MKKSIILFFVSAIAIFAWTTSVKIYPDSPLYPVSEAINSSNYFIAPAFQMDSMSVSFYPYWTKKDTTDPDCRIVWTATKPHPRYYGLTEDTLDPIGKYGSPISDEVITIDAINDSIWANVTYVWNHDIGVGTPNPIRHQLRSNMGYSVWNYEDSTVSDIVTEYLVPVAGEYARILFPVQLARYAYSFNWKTAVGPLGSTERADAESDCGIDLPKRYSEYGIPEILKICEVMGVKPNFVYTRVSDTAYCVLDTFEYTYIDTFHDTLEIERTDTVYRKSLGDDAREFAEYLFGDTATSGWAKLRERDGFPEPVNTDRIMIGNDLMSDLVMDIAQDYLYDPRHNKAFWPKKEITKALMDSGAVDSIAESLYSDYTDYEDRLRHLTLRHKARLQCIASAFKSVKSDLRVGVFTCGFWFYRAGAHSYLGAAALAADSIDYYGFHRYSAGGHNDESKDRRLNYSDICADFMGDTASDGSSIANHYLLNETLGDMHVTNFFKYHIEKDVPKYKNLANSTFSFTPPIKPLEITESNMSHHYYYEKEWDPQISVFNAIKLLEHKRAFYWLSGQNDYNLEVVQSFKMACAATNWPFVWGYDTVGQRLFREDSIYSHYLDGGNSWSPECGYGIHATYLASVLYNDIGFRAIRYDPLALETASNISWSASGTFPSRDWSVWTAEDTLDSDYTLCNDFKEVVDPSFSKITIDPYIDSKGAINMIIVNRDTVGVCTLTVSLGDTIIFDSLEVWRLGINDSIWKEACYYVYGDSNFLPLGFAHNGFTYDSSGVKLRFQPVYLDSCDTINAIDQTIETDSSTYFALELDPMSFARVRVVPKQDSVAITLHPGWNMVSIPMYTRDTLLADIFDRSNILRWDRVSDEYVDYCDSANVPGESYWVKNEDTIAVTIWVKGVPCRGFGVEVFRGWNMTGSVWESRRFADNFNPDTVMFDPYRIWYWDNSIGDYRDTSCVTPTWGYWSLAKNGFLQFPDSNVACAEDSERMLSYKQLYSLRYEPEQLDSGNIYCSISNDTIFVTNRGSQNLISGCMVLIETGDTTVIGYTDKQDGIFTDDLIDKNDSTYIFLYKPGYRKLLIYPYGAIDSDTFQSDIVIYGDVTIGSNDTLVILPGTNIYMKPTSAVWNYAYGVNSKTEIMAYGGHVRVLGTEDDPVHFHPGSGGSGLYQWGGLWAKVGGSFDVSWAQFDSCDGVGGYPGGNGPGRMKLTNTRHIGNQGVFGSWNGAGTIDGWFQMDSCYVEGRAMWYSNEDSCWARACSLSGSVTAGESYYTYQCGEPVEIEDCYLFGYNNYGGRAYGDINFTDCQFVGGSAVYNYATISLMRCDIDADSDNYGLYITSSAPDTTSVDADSTIFHNYSSAGVFTYKNVQFMIANCFITDDAQFTFNGPKEKLTIWLDHCYLDILIKPDHFTVDLGHTSDECYPDPTLSKVLGDDGKPILPENFSLGNAVPNPFNSTVAIEIDVPKDAEVVFEIFNILGDKIITLIDEELGRGRYKIVWNGLDSGGRELPSGTYLYRLRSENFEQTKKMTLVK